MFTQKEIELLIGLLEFAIDDIGHLLVPKTEEEEKLIQSFERMRKKFKEML